MLSEKPKSCGRKGVRYVAVNTYNNYRIGSVNNRCQFYNPKTDCWYKKDTTTGKIIAVKCGAPFKGVAKHTDLRRCN